MSDPYAEIRQLAKDETRLISAESYSTLRRFVLAALPVVEAATEMRLRLNAIYFDQDWAISLEEIREWQSSIERLEEVTRGQ